MAADLDQRCAERVWEILPQLMRAVSTHWRQQNPHIEITLRQLFLLRILREKERAVGELASRFLVSMPTLTRILDGLVEKGLVERREDPSDRRMVRLSLTEKGIGLSQEFEERAVKCVQGMIVSLPDEQKETVIQAMDAFEAALRCLPAKERKNNNG